MCVAIPMKVIEIKDNIILCEYEGVKRVVRGDLLKNVSVGDYVIIHAGFAIQKLDLSDAMETIKIYKEIENIT
ncbi:MAG: HypC/HybG/HupF family hydrogenase formation chaperone [Endomicrobiia bacterium]